jgi:hypothetical protein
MTTEAPERVHPASADEEGGDQVTAFPGGHETPPPGWISPPKEDQFDSGIYLTAGPEIVALVDDVLDMDECRSLSTVALDVVWRRKGKPHHGEAPAFAGVELAPPVWRWVSSTRLGGSMAVALNLYWQWFAELREEGSYVHPETFKQHVHAALMRIEVGDEGALSTRAPALQVFPETVARFGAYNSGLVQLAKQLPLMGDAEA